MSKTLDPGILINVTENTYGDLHPTLSDFSMKATPNGTTKATITIKFDVEIDRFLNTSKTYTDAQWKAMAKKKVHFGFKKIVGSTEIDSSAGLTFSVSDVNPSDQEVEITSEFKIVNAKVGGAG